MSESDANVILLLDFIFKRCAQGKPPTMVDLRQFRHSGSSEEQSPRSRAAVARDLERARQLGARVHTTRLGQSWVYQIHNSTNGCNQILDAARLVRRLREQVATGFSA